MSNVKTVSVVKYLSAIVILTAMLFHTFGWTPWNSFLQLTGAAGWIYVGWKQNEKALLLNFVPQYLIIVPGLIIMLVGS